MPYQQHHVAPFTETGFPRELGNIFENLAKGYQMGNLPRDTMLKQEGERLKNALSGIELNYAPRMNDAKLGLIGQQIKESQMNTDPEKYLAYVNRLSDALRGGSSAQSQSNESMVSRGKVAAPSFAPNQGGNDEIPPEYRGSQGDNDMLQAALQEYGQQPQRPAPSQGMDMREMMLRKKLGIPLETPSEIENRAIDTEFYKDLNKKDIETAESFSKDYIAAVKQEPTIKELARLTNSPVFQEMKTGTDLIAPNLSMGYYKKFGKPEQKKLAGYFEGAVKKFVTDSKDVFGSRMTDRDLRFLESMKPNNDDSIESMQGKVEGIARFNEAMKQRAKFSDMLFRQHRFTPIQATEAANKAINLDAIEEEVRKNLKIGGAKNYSVAEIRKMDRKAFEEYYRGLSPSARRTVRQALGS